MRVILLEEVERVGRQGELITVRDGFARNYLLPKRKALRVTESQLKRLDEVKKQLTARAARAAKQLSDRVARIESLALKAELRVGAEGKAFGSITGAMVAELLAQQDCPVDKHDVLLEEPIKEPGVHDVVVRVGPETKATVKLWVTAQPVDSQAPTADS